MPFPVRTLYRALDHRYQVRLREVQKKQRMLLAAGCSVETVAEAMAPLFREVAEMKAERDAFVAQHGPRAARARKSRRK